jgi:hypothetical protein
MYVIKGKGKVLRDGNNILMFEYIKQAERYIEERCGCSPYCRIEEWRKK